MGRKKHGKCVKKNQNILLEPEELVTAPHSFVIHKGLAGGNIQELTKDFRKVMEPFTAVSLKERKNNTIKDFVHVAGALHVSHLCIFSRSDLGMYFKTSRLPRGPTLTYSIKQFSLARDVVSSLKKQMVMQEAFNHSPLIILNGFSGEGLQMKLMASMFQNMFPTINLTKIDLNRIRRCVLLNYNQNTKTIDFRHYIIKVAPVGVSKGIKKIVQGKVPNLARCEDISEFFTKTGAMSESEFEEDANTHVILSQKLAGRGNLESGKSAIRLTELGPRLTLQLVKIEDGLLDGEVLYHELVQKTDEEKEAIQKKREAKKKLKEKRKNVQEQNKRMKEKKKIELKEKSLKGMKKVEETSENATEENAEVEDDDAEYYRQEVGEEPDKELFSSRPARLKRPAKPYDAFKSKKPRLDEENSQNKSNRKFDKNDKFSRKFDKNNKFNNKFDKNDKFNKKFDKNEKFNKSKGRNKNSSGRKPFDKQNRKNKGEKTNAKNRDFRPIGGKGAMKKGVRKFKK